MEGLNTNQRGFDGGRRAKTKTSFRINWER